MGKGSYRSMTKWDWYVYNLNRNRNREKHQQEARDQKAPAVKRQTQSFTEWLWENGYEWKVVERTVFYRKRGGSGWSIASASDEARGRLV